MSFNFELALFALSVLTGAVYLVEWLVFRPRRQAAANRVLRDFDGGRAHSLRATGGEAAVAQARKGLQESVARQPWWIEYSVSFFPVILFVFMLRSFIVEPFRIPSGSMIPTLQVGDLILVNKFIYGIRLPVIKKKVVELQTPKRGDVMVFRFPVDPTLDYIKRVVGVPGDTVEYRDKRLLINGDPVPLQPLPDYFDPERANYSKQFYETLGEVGHKIIVDAGRRDYLVPKLLFPHSSACRYTEISMTCVVPPGHYFMMGDNRDNSEDSRYWGFVPEQNIVGKAFFVWMNFGDLKRIGSFQ
jgi:signal peptidase I